jgi:hypothetical protein
MEECASTSSSEEDILRYKAKSAITPMVGDVLRFTFVPATLLQRQLLSDLNNLYISDMFGQRNIVFYYVAAKSHIQRLPIEWRVHEAGGLNLCSTNLPHCS